jgi:NDP-mannose synthase
MSEIALVMAGGRSERMRATSGPRHKALTDVGGMTLIERNVLQLGQAGFAEIVVALGAGEAELAQYVRTALVPLARAHGASLRAVVETAPLGNIGFAGTFGGGAGDVLVIYVDNLCALDPRALLEHHRRHRYDLTIAAHEEPFQIPYGELDVRDGRVVGYREKPVVRLRVSSGTCVVGVRARALITPGQRLDARDLFALVNGAGLAAGAYEHDAPWVDVNDAAAARRAEALIAEHPSAFPGVVRA